MICQICANDKVHEVKVEHTDKTIWLCYECVRSWLVAEGECIGVAKRPDLDDDAKKKLIVPAMAAIFGSLQADSCVSTILASICHKMRPYFKNRKNLLGQFTKSVKEYRMAHYNYIPRY